MKRLLSLVLSLFIIAGAALPSALNTAYAAQPENHENYGVFHMEVPFTSYSDLGMESRFSKQVGKTVSLPKAYSSVDLGYITPTKSQGNYGMCWAFSTMTASEASIIKHLGFPNEYENRVNLSELHFAYFLYNNAYDSMKMLKGDANIPGKNFLAVGSDPLLTPFTLAAWIGVANTKDGKNYGYGNAKADYTIKDKSEAYANTIIHLENMFWVNGNDRNDIKQMIMQYGAGTFSYADNDEYMNTRYHCFYNPNIKATNHMVTVVGWDDNFSKDNFSKKARPKENGAWLCQNTWGDDWGDDGYFWISYENATNPYDWCQFFDYGTSDNFDKNYQYDGTASPYTQEATLGCTMANVFTCESGEELKAVSFWTAQNDVEYTINIYKDLTDKNDPASGTAVLASPINGTQDYCGYHTIRLEKPVRLNAGETFSVVVTLSANAEDTTKLFIDCSTDTEYVSFKSSAKKGQSFFQASNGTQWKDISLEGKNCRIKAFTNVIDDSVVIKYDNSPDETEVDSDITTDTEDGGLLSSLFNRIYDWFTGDSGDKGDISLLGYMLGDANSDKQTNMFDVVTMQRAVAKLTTLEGDSFKAADIDEDGKLTMTDIVILQLHLAKLL